MAFGTAVVTAASSGIGHATALHLHSLGFAVLAGVRSDEAAERVLPDRAMDALVAHALKGWPATCPAGGRPGA